VRIHKVQYRALSVAGLNGPIPQYEFAWGPRKPLWPTAWAPLSAVSPPVPLGALTRGQTELQRSAFAGWTLTPSAQSTESPLSLLAGSFDFTFVVLAVFPLLAIALTWDLLSGEAEAGTLGLLLSHPVRMGQIVCGKLLARAATLFVLYASILILAAVVAVPPEPGSLGRFAIH
jgi:ABC-2 type transport system permease protein